MPSPEQPQPDHIIEAAVQRATDAAATYLTAAASGADKAELDPLIDAIYDPLRQDLTRESLLRAVVLSVSVDAETRARQRLRTLGEVDRRKDDGRPRRLFRRRRDPVDAADDTLPDWISRLRDDMTACEASPLIDEIYNYLREHTK